eukprot:Lithocolla_globosa_v1_NODE_1613_length_2447_cov_7.895067.p1 type:complete len:647 gc:universal NODE_1613_length_2447_cov_7.895067:2035-95(-)
MWQWLYGPLISQLGDGPPFNVYKFNRLIGAIRLRQIRVSNDSCVVSPMFEEAFGEECYSFDVNRRSLDTNSFGPPGDPYKYNFSTADETLAEPYWGKFGVTYPASGNYKDIDPTDLYDAFQELQADQWVSRHTRMVQVTMYFANINVNLVSQVIAVFEFSGGGGVFPSIQIRNMILNSYETTSDIFRAIGELIVVVLFIIYIIWEFLELLSIRDMEERKWKLAHQEGEAPRNKRVQFILYKRAVLTYMSDFWNIIDWANIVMFIVFTTVYGSYVVKAAKTSREADLGKSSFLNYEHLARQSTVTYELLTTNIFLCFWKFFKFLRFNSRMNLLWGTLIQALGDLVVLVLFLAIVLTGYACSGVFVFGPGLDGHADFSSSISTIARWMMQEYDYEALQDENRFLTPLFFYSYVIFVYFTLVNLVLAILNDAYARQHANVEHDESPFKAIAESAKDNIRYFKKEKPDHHHIITEIFDREKEEVEMDLSNEPESQLKWEESMAQSVADRIPALNKGEEARVYSLLRHGFKRAKKTEEDSHLTLAEHLENQAGIIKSNYLKTSSSSHGAGLSNTKNRTMLQQRKGTAPHRSITNLAGLGSQTVEEFLAQLGPEFDNYLSAFENEGLGINHLPLLTNDLLKVNPQKLVKDML